MGLSSWSLGRPPRGREAGYCSCWSLVPSAQGWFPEWRPLGSPQAYAGEAPVGHRWGPKPPRTSPANHRAYAPTPSKTAKGPCPDPPHHKHSWGWGGAVPRKPTSLGHELLSPLLSLDPTQAGGASVSPKWGHLQHSRPGASLVTPASPTVD